MSKVVVHDYNYETKQDTTHEFEGAQYGMEVYGDYLVAHVYRDGGIIASFKDWDSVEVSE